MRFWEISNLKLFPPKAEKACSADEIQEAIGEEKLWNDLGSVEEKKL